MADSRYSVDRFYSEDDSAAQDVRNKTAPYEVLCGISAIGAFLGAAVASASTVCLDFKTAAIGGAVFVGSGVAGVFFSRKIDKIQQSLYDLHAK